MTEFVVVVEWKVHVLQSMHVEHFLVQKRLHFRNKHNCNYLIHNSMTHKKLYNHRILPP